MISGSSTICRARMRGLSDEYGSWKTICMSRRASRIRRREKPSTSSPRNLTLPDVGSTSRRTQRPVVVFPLPDSPTSPNVSPASIVKLTSSTALTSVPVAQDARVADEVLHEVRDFNERHRLGARGLRPGLVQKTLGRASRPDAVVGLAAPSCSGRNDPGSAG